MNTDQKTSEPKTSAATGFERGAIAAINHVEVSADEPREASVATQRIAIGLCFVIMGAPIIVISWRSMPALYLAGVAAPFLFALALVGRRLAISSRNWRHIGPLLLVGSAFIGFAGDGLAPNAWMVPATILGVALFGAFAKTGRLALMVLSTAAVPLSIALARLAGVVQS